MKNSIGILLTVAMLAVSCSDEGKEKTAAATTKDSTVTSNTNTPNDSAAAQGTPADAATIMARKQVPVLCYHHIKDVPPSQLSKYGYDVTVRQFKEQMKTLHDSGYQTILPDQLYDYLVYGKALPPKPVMLTYDDTDEEQFSIAKPEMDKYNFKGVYFLMTIPIGRPRYMTKEQIKQLADEGHAVECHTWDHHRVDRYIVGDRTITANGKQKTFNDWDVQLTGAKKTIEGITGKPVTHFAYPFGLWSKEGIPEIQKRGYKLAFQLSTKRDSLQPLYTVRRIIVDPNWSATGLLKVMQKSFP